MRGDGLVFKEHRLLNELNGKSFWIIFIRLPYCCHCLFISFVLFHGLCGINTELGRQLHYRHMVLPAVGNETSAKLVGGQSLYWSFVGDWQSIYWTNIWCGVNWVKLVGSLSLLFLFGFVSVNELVSSLKSISSTYRSSVIVLNLSVVYSQQCLFICEYFEIC